jgi:hypothetical protein
MSNGGGNPRDGRRLSVAGAEHDDGFGMSAPAECRIHLGGRADRLTGVVGIDDETPGTAATAVIDADGEELLRVELAAGDVAAPFVVDLRGRSTLTLRTEPISDTPAHVDWASTALIGIHQTQSQHPGR